MTTPLISVRGLKQRLGEKEILHGLDFTVMPGRIVGLVGHNGAGKTTAINAILGLRPAAGELRVLGRDPFAHRVRLMRDVAFIGDIASLPRFLRVDQLLAITADIHPNFSRAGAEDLLAGGEVTMRAKIGKLSKGMLAQLHLAIVLSIEAKLLVLDEPTLGLDITYRKGFYKRLAEDYMRPERAILITTHQIDEIEALLTDIVFMRDGRIVLDLPMDGVAARFAQLVAPNGTPPPGGSAPIFSESRFGQTVMIFDGVAPEALAGQGTVSTPALSDLFVALMHKERAV